MSVATEVPLIQRIEDEILAGRLKPGAHLREVTLAERFEVSRTPLRQALVMLSECGWVKLIPNVGAFVREFSPREVAELFLVRRELEGLAAELACAVWNEERARELREVADEYREHRTAKRYYETRRANCRFHRYIVDATGCQALIDTVQRGRIILRSEMARHPFEDQLGETPATTAVTHYDILEALEARNAARAREAARQHLEQVRVRLNQVG